MDPIESITVKKDSTFAMLLEAQRRGWGIRYMQPEDLYLEGDRAYALMHHLTVEDHPQNWHQITHQEQIPLDELDVILMRKDPPFDMEYVYTTYLLERAEAMGVLVVNRPSSLRDCNEKLFTAWFPQCCPPTLVTRRHKLLLSFLEKQKDIIMKPLDGMGGASIFRCRQGDPNTNVIMETLTQHEANYTMAQRFIPEITEGDKRILMPLAAPARGFLSLSRITGLPTRWGPHYVSEASCLPELM